MTNQDVQEALHDMMEVIREAPEPYFLIDFHAPWCGPCRALGPALEKLAANFKGKVRFGKVNVDDNQELAVGLQVDSLPTVMIFDRQGTMLQKWVAPRPTDIAAYINTLE